MLHELVCPRDPLTLSPGLTMAFMVLKCTMLVELFTLGGLPSEAGRSRGGERARGEQWQAEGKDWRGRGD